MHQASTTIKEEGITTQLSIQKVLKKLSIQKRSTNTPDKVKEASLAKKDRLKQS
jgi:hypothetical protein